MKTPKFKRIILKFLSLFSVVRGYNILVLVVAQYLAAIFIFSPSTTLKDVVLDVHLFYLVAASVFVIAGGYIINAFYDVQIDKINKPVKVGLDSYVRQSTKLKLYFTLNFIGFFFGILVSWRAALFFAVYIFAIWLYSHKLKKNPLFGVFSAAILTILPFFAVFVHYNNYSKIIFVHAAFLFLVVLVRELLKDLENIKGAIANNYNTFSVVYGESKTKKVILFLLILTLIPVFILFNYAALSSMVYYFYFALAVLIFVGIYLWKSVSKDQFRLLHNILKILLFIGVLCLIFIDTSLLLEKVIDRLN
ncbi:geranylgeranylglycerol-phosphate geranylgeranyltransferase [Polaribacter tangerinus]|uniref:geranylgeranylglycerol-phosphate geranylgeranyltransferase n=1 Tax=Polaribacter tangerinus TaxID=1920034 RepID=UPI000B4AFD6C|nr:geranylgeranylglycerol-phosphate geranylgeranyltransferase [Polaribacter tangerinus]